MIKFCVPLLLIILFSCHQREKNETKLTPEITAIYPTSDSLPENLLRLYINFSQPMKAVNNLENIKLINEEGNEIKGAIFNNVYELWDTEQKQLTIILDPSRVKTGLIANENLGRALVPGKHFKLVIEKAKDIYDNQLVQPYVKDFFVTKADIQMPDITNWEIDLPHSNSKSSLQIIFPQILDRLSLLNRIRVIDGNNEVIDGVVKVSNQEKMWHFTPDNRWKEGSYTLQVNSRLEDPAGNNLNGLFDHKIGSLKNANEGIIIDSIIHIK